MKKGTLETADELIKKIQKVDEMLSVLKFLKDSTSIGISNMCVFGNIEISDGCAKKEILNIAEKYLLDKRADYKLDFDSLVSRGYIGPSSPNIPSVQDHLLKTVGAILNHLNKAPETQPDGSIILKDRKG